MSILLTKLSCTVVVVDVCMGRAVPPVPAPLLSLAVRVLCKISMCFPWLVLVALGLEPVGQQLLYLHLSTEGSKP